MTKQIFSSPKAFPAGHIGNMSKGKDEGIGEICPSKPTWFDSRTATPMMHFALAISERRTNKMYAELEKQITSPIFFKANGNFNLGYGVVNGNIYLCDNGIVFASVDSKPHRMQEIPAEQIWYFEFDPIHVLLHTRDGWVYEITLPNAQEVQKALEGKYGL